MNFGELKQELYDRLGGTYETTLVERFVNEATQRVAASGKFRELEKSASISLLAAGTTQCPSWVRDVIEIDDDNGKPLKQKDRDAWEDLYQEDGRSGAARPTAFCVRGMDASGTLTVETRPLTVGAVSGTVRGLRRPATMTGDSDVPELPAELHWSIVDAAVAMLREWEESDMASLATERAVGGASQAVGEKGSPIVRDRT